jgi:hypothetical protein
MFHHIHHALAQVRELRARVLEHQMFRGYSARARAGGAAAALLGAAVMSNSRYPKSVEAHVWGWGCVCLLAALLNYGDVLLWYSAQPAERRERGRLRPVLDGLPPLFVGAVLTAVFLREGKAELLFGMWMCLFGLTHLSSRHSLPKEIWWLGCYYIAAGTVFLLAFDRRSFLDPWPMGLIFFCGELTGAYILFIHRKTFLERRERLAFPTEGERETDNAE